jgi:hypothetical protein
MVLDLFEYAEEADDEVDAVHDQADADETYQRRLVVADAVTQTVFKRAETAVRRTWELIVPRYSRGSDARDEGGEEVVEAEGEGGGPGTDEDDLEKGVRQLAGGAPETERTPEVFQLRRRLLSTMETSHRKFSLT